MDPLHKSQQRMSESLFEAKLKKEDSLDFALDDQFFEKMHDQIMATVEKTEMKSPSRWTKSWVFLEAKAKRQKWPRKAAKIGVVGLTLSMAVLLLSVSVKMYQDIFKVQMLGNKILILQEAKQDPAEWSNLVVNYQNESDFYADILSQKNDIGTIVEIDRVMSESL